MESTRFDALTKAVGRTSSRRTTVRIALGVLASLAGVAASEAGTLRKGRDPVRSQSLQDNERCDPPKTKHGKRLGCNDCATGFSVAFTNSKGRTVRKCACKPSTQPCSPNRAWQCCTGLCEGGTCRQLQAAPPPPPPPPPPTTTPPPPPFCAGKNNCTTPGGLIRCDVAQTACSCWVTVTGQPHCGGTLFQFGCEGCAEEGGTCVDLTGCDFSDTEGCVQPCTSPQL